MISLEESRAWKPGLTGWSDDILRFYSWRPALGDEPVERGPEMPLVSSPAAFACRAERLAWAASCPDGAVVWPSGAPQGITPSADSGKEMALCVFSDIIGLHLLYRPCVHIPSRN